MSEWSVAEPKKLSFDDPVTTLRVRVVNGTVNVVGTDEGSARLEVSELEGPPLQVTQEGGTLTVAYEDLPWKGFLKWLDRKGWRRAAVVSLAVPTGTRVEVGVVGAAAVVSGVDGRVEVKGVTGDTTLVRVAGPVRVDTVSGNLEAQAVTGDLRFHSVSGDLTVVEGSGTSVRAESVSGSMIVDLDATGAPTDVQLSNVSGEIAIRLPHPADAEVEANTASGTVSSAFEDLRVNGQWGAKKITGRLGAGNGRLKAVTVSGSIALLRRPPAEDETYDEAPEPREAAPPTGPVDTAGHATGDTTSGTPSGTPSAVASDTVGDDAAEGRPADTPTDKKVL
ncbi:MULTISPECIES: DUF4097 family beta strand repeat-containing protein [unclassified Streptomyces]|uniref:DUF4097 family beta strand repeat-containing protein n=1 Tax=unclassified Streptomyces TaxID=2593676 RepID=UPI00225946A8|nr:MULTISPECIES: DUF4097 family beta strand repeat-containing protein [unclassified Streptomyces]MCX4988502.1 DUF4097 family beta strand repeat-containing protein [Streptomyces sp. NBC_00568]MCX5006277.1 DUF4097 family beta strand repeat-containing protein [Streptomyces sp. NBC_00638]